MSSGGGSRRRIVPFTLELPEVDALDAGEEPYVPITFPVFGAIVMPGNVSFLNQFFDATLIVANGAPSGARRPFSTTSTPRLACREATCCGSRRPNRRSRRDRRSR